MQETTINCNYIYVLQIFTTVQSNTFDILLSQALPVGGQGIFDHLVQYPQSKMSKRLKLGEVMHCSDEHPKYIHLFWMLHVCQCRCGNLNILHQNIYFLISGTLHVALLMGKAGGPVQVHFFGQVHFHTSSMSSSFSSPAGQPKPQQIEVEFKFQSPTLITGLDIGNFWSAR